MTEVINSCGLYRANIDITALIAELDRLDDRIVIHKTPYVRYTFRGVPGRRVDIIIAESLLALGEPAGAAIEITDRRPQELPPALADVAVEIGDKRGKYDGAIRRRYAIHATGRGARKFPGGIRADELPSATFRVFRDAREVTVILVPKDRPAIMEGYISLQSDLQDYDLERIVIWHWTRYYKHIPYAEAAAAASEWAAAAHAGGQLDGWTLAEANRAASRHLYRLSRDLGWRKLTTEEKERLGLPADAPQWHRQEEIAAILSRTGCGEATLTAAGFGRWEIGERDIDIVHAADACRDGGIAEAIAAWERGEL